MRFSTKCWSEHILSAYKATKDLKYPLYMTFKMMGLLTGYWKTGPCYVLFNCPSYAGAHDIEKPYTEIYSWWWQTLHWEDLWWQILRWDLRLVLRKLTLRYTHGGDKPYTETCLYWWETLQWDLSIKVTNLSLKTCSCWWQTVQWKLLTLA